MRGADLAGGWPGRLGARLVKLPAENDFVEALADVPLVPYWSSHLPGAVSEKMIPSQHNAQQTPVAFDEVKRFLKLHDVASANGSRKWQGREQIVHTQWHRAVRFALWFAATSLVLMTHVMRNRMVAVLAGVVHI